MLAFNVAGVAAYPGCLGQFGASAAVKKPLALQQEGREGDGGGSDDRCDRVCIGIDDAYRPGQGVVDVSCAPIGAENDAPGIVTHGDVRLAGRQIRIADVHNGDIVAGCVDHP